MSRPVAPRRWLGPAIGVLAVGLTAACGDATPAATQATSGAEATSEPGVTASLVASAGPVFNTPLDAVPASGGDAIYFTANSAGGRGVFADLAGRPAPQALAVGSPLRSPTGIALSTDERTLYVADPDADAVFTVPVTGGTPAVLAGSQGLRPRGLEVAGDLLYATGVDPVGHTGAVFSLPVAGGTPKTIAGGLSMPDGIAIRADGAIFVTDRPGTVLRIVNAAAASIVTDVSLGAPAGLTLSADGSTLLVSSLNPAAGTAQVLLLDLASGQTRVFDDVIRENRAPGGLHRAHQGDIAAWADVQGKVYRVRTG